MKLLFVVHRYGYPGGSEQYTKSMAEESLRRGHTVAVFAGEHTGDINGIHVTNNTNILAANWDLIIVHGGDVAVQNFVLSNAKNIPSPILYLIVLPSTTDVCIKALQDCAFIGCSTRQDWIHCEKYGVTNKAVNVRHGIAWQDCMGKSGFKVKHGITGKMFLSCGGYWPNKAMKELATVFEICNPQNATLVTTGYDNRMNLMPTHSSLVRPMLINNREEVLSAIYDADCLLMHSYQEGFGLVLLEAMLNQTPWIARKIAGAELMQQYGCTYESDAELIFHIRTFNRNDFDIKGAYDYVCANHLISHTIDDIELITKL
jgi:glycosyltransferase involved in cell wall biosynthesis